MKLPSGKVISSEVLREIAKDWAESSLVEEHATDMARAIAECLEQGAYGGTRYDEADRAAIIGALQEVVTTMAAELKAAFQTICSRHLVQRMLGKLGVKAYCLTPEGIDVMDVLGAFSYALSGGDCSPSELELTIPEVKNLADMSDERKEVIPEVINRLVSLGILSVA